jgi:hypothetical protein
LAESSSSVILFLAAICAKLVICKLALAGLVSTDSAARRLALASQTHNK